jgi:small-conductance mechanosensitive channel
VYAAVTSALFAPPRTPVPGPDQSPTCTDAPGLCRQIYEWTHLTWLAEGSYYILAKPFRVVLIIALAVLTRLLVHRLVNRLVSRVVAGESIALPGALRERIPTALREATGLPSERRRQRATALASVLRSVASAVIAAVAVMLILDELGLNLAPILASAGIAGLAIGFGAQNLVKDFIAGLFMLLEDQYGIGDVIDVGEVSGTVEGIGLRITTLRDPQGVVWYIRNGEIVRVGNKSQGWALVTVDVPVGFAAVDQATEIVRNTATDLAEDPQWADDILEPPEMLGVEQFTSDGAVLRVAVKTPSEARSRIGRELRRRLAERLREAGVAAEVGTGGWPTASGGNEPGQGEAG